LIIRLRRGEVRNEAERRGKIDAATGLSAQKVKVSQALGYEFLIRRNAGKSHIDIGAGAFYERAP
jgi:hypothetical protein